MGIRRDEAMVVNGRLTQAGASFRSDEKCNRSAVFECECGTRLAVVVGKVKSGHTGSCGCLQKEATSAAKKTHGQSRGRTYRIWKGIKNRCENPNRIAYADYGGRGISLCDRWQSFEMFVADVGQVPVGMSIERINNSGNYEPGNVSFATAASQSRNKRNNVMITANGKTQCLSDWAAELRCSEHCLSYRMDRGWSHHQVVNTPVQVQRKQFASGRVRS